MNISVFGLGYVGCVSLGCLAKMGHRMIGVDVSDYKNDLINRGIPTIIEKDIDLLIKEFRNNRTIEATSDYEYAVLNTEVSIICVGTPSTIEGKLNLEHLFKCAKQIGKSIKKKKTFHVVAIRSTVMPGTNKEVGNIISSVTGSIVNDKFAVVSNPEFLREGSAVSDYFNPPVTVLGTTSDKAMFVMKEVYKNIQGEIVEVDVEVAEMIKYVNNSYHALKVVFANEVGNICKKMNIDSHEVMNLFCKDKQLNLSSYYLKPGFAYGGSCLPKDLKALKTLASCNNLKSPVLMSIEESNTNQKEILYSMIKETKKRKIGFIGVSFKEGTDDLRYSPVVDVIQKLFREDSQVRIYDKNVSKAVIVGSNKQYLEEHIPYLEELIVDDIDVLVSMSEVVIISQRTDVSAMIIDKYTEVVFIDLVRISNRMSGGNYIGIAW